MGTCEDVWRLYVYTGEQSEATRYLGVACSSFSIQLLPQLAFLDLAFIGLVSSLHLPSRSSSPNFCSFLLYCQTTPEPRAWVGCGNLPWGTGYRVSLLAWLCIFLSSLAGNLVSRIYMGPAWLLAGFPDSAGSTRNALLLTLYCDSLLGSMSKPSPLTWV